MADFDFDTDNPSPSVLRFQGPWAASPGSFLDAFVGPGSGGLQNPFGVIFGPDANSDGQLDLYVTDSELPGHSLNSKSAGIKLFDGVTGTFIRDFVDAKSNNQIDAGLLVFSETDPVTLAYQGGTARQAAFAPASISGPPNTTEGTPNIDGRQSRSERNDGGFAPTETLVARSVVQQPAGTGLTSRPTNSQPTYLWDVWLDPRVPLLVPRFHSSTQ